MCYYNTLRRTGKITLLQLMAEAPEFIRDMQSGFTYPDWPVVMKDGTGIKVEMAHWEFIPYWISDPLKLEELRKMYATLNATSEKILISKMFRESALKRRCLVLSSGFYEWRHYKPESSKKDIAYPYFIHMPDHPYFYMAGIHSYWTDTESGEMLNTFAIVTTQSNELMTQIHNKKKRMPSILPEELAYKWVMDKLSEQEIQEIASHQHNLNKLVAYTVKKDFREAYNPQEPFEYPELPAIQLFPA